MPELILENQQKQSLSQRVIQKAELLQMNTSQLDSFLENILIENPLVDIDASYTKENSITLDSVSEIDFIESDFIESNQAAASVKTDPMLYYARQEALSLQQQLYIQLLPHLDTIQDRNIMQYLIDSLDERGYLTVSDAGLCSHFHISPDKARMYIAYLHNLEPAGIGAHNLQECLLLQLARRQHPQKELAEQLIAHHLQDIAEKRQKQLHKLLKINEMDLQQAIMLIRSLNPIPLNGADSADKIVYIRPDIIISKEGGRFTITLSRGSIYRLHMESAYTDLMKHGTCSEKKYLRTKYQGITWINHCLDSRESTLTRVAHMILTHQSDFFNNGPERLIPYEQTMLARQLSLNASTVSRAIHDKYLQCCWGIFPLKYFFPKALPDADNGITTHQVKDRIRSLIAKEDQHHPLSDQKIADILNQENMLLSRRTVAKYRAELNIPDTSHRRQS